MSSTILHLSDLHFGYDSDQTARHLRHEAFRLLVRVLGRVDHDWHPDILIVSGDLTYQGKANGYEELQRWLSDQLLPATGLTFQDCVFCPGNHDLDRRVAKPLLRRARDWAEADDVLRPEDLSEGFARPFNVFSNFVRELGCVLPQTSAGSSALYGTLRLKGVSIVVANSAWFCRDSGSDRGHLWLGQHLLRSLTLMDAERYDNEDITIALVHHPPDWLADAETTSYEGRVSTYKYLAERVHIILSGHTHGGIELPNRYYNRALLMSGGATYADATYRNNFSLLKINEAERTIERRSWEFDSRGPVWRALPSSRHYLKGDAQSNESALSVKDYLAWLEADSGMIELEALKVAPDEAPRPDMDSLFVSLSTMGGKGAESKTASGTPSIKREDISLFRAIENRRVLIEGEAGSGKTTFLRRVALAMCRGSRDSILTMRGLPILVKIRQLDEHINSTLARPKQDDPTIVEDPRWISHFMGSQNWGLDERQWGSVLRSSTTTLLLDGLDEAGSERRRESIASLIRSAAQRLGCAIILTSRPGASRGNSLFADWHVARIAPLDTTGIQCFLRQWCHWLRKGDSKGAEAYFRDLWSAVNASPAIRKLSENPLMLTSLAVVHLQNRRLPQDRAALYELIMQWLAAQAERKHPDYSKDLRLRAFGTLALAMQEWDSGVKLEIGCETASKLLGSKFPGLSDPSMFVEQTQVDSGVITLRGGKLSFWHRGFQEYLSARSLSGLSDESLHKKCLQMVSEPGNWEVLSLLAGRMAESAQERLDTLLSAILAAVRKNSSLEFRSRVAAAIASMLFDASPLGFAEQPETKAKFEQLLLGLKRHLCHPYLVDRVGLNMVAIVLEALDRHCSGRLLFPREDGYWCQIEGGAFEIGGDSAYQALQRQVVELDAFELARFPVTVYEYGYYLSQNGITPPPELRWHEQKRYPSRPITRVDWFQAQRYCTWVEGHWGISCRLPSEMEWELAAGGKEKRTFPWGSELDDVKVVNYHANIKRSLGRISPVGLFPLGSTPEGVEDLSGNVLEWTSSDFAWKDGPHPSRENSKVLRGGCFLYGPRYLPVTTRFWDVPDDSGDHIGFRCARTLR